MNKNIILKLLAAIFVLAACDYNDKHFEGYDDITITDIVHYEGEFTGAYPGEGYFTSNAAVETAVSSMLKDMYLYCDSGSTAKISLLYGETIPAEHTKVTPNDVYTLTPDDYDAMGTNSGEPGRYDNFDANMDIDHYLTVFLKIKYPYAAADETCEVTYQYYSGGTTTQSSIYKCNGSVWEAYDPYAEAVEVTTRIADMLYDGDTWKLKLLLGGTEKFTMVAADYAALVSWVIANKPAYLSTQNTTQEEFYFGASIYQNYNNINNRYSTWKSYYDVEGTYVGLSDNEMQAIMDQRMQEAITVILLPAWITAPYSGMSYVVTYKVYAGRGDGLYNMTFMYDEDITAFVYSSGPVKE